MIPKNKFSLRENVRLRLLKDMVTGVKLAHPVPNFILILDPYTTKIVSACIKMIEFLEEGVVALERLELSRKQFPKMHAIYFVSPSEDSVNKMLSDFTNPKDPQYGNVHLFFTNHVDNALVDKMSKQKPFISRVLTFKELNLDFLSPEANLFHLNMPEAFSTIFSKVGFPEERALEASIAEKLATIVPTLFDFEKFHIIYNKNPKNRVSENVAKILKERIDKFLALKKNQDDEPAAPIKIVILDRSFDPLTPLLHDYYYQSLVYDLLDVAGDIAEYDSEDNTGKITKKKAVLSDKDELWSKYRHQFIGEAMVNISKEFEEFVANNRTAQMRKTDMSNLNLDQMSNIVKQMPMYQEVLGKYTLHMNLIQECVKLFNHQELKEIGELEQSLATGVDGDGRSIPTQKLLTALRDRLSQPNLSKRMRFRLMLITTIALELTDKDRKPLMQYLDENDRANLLNLTHLGVDPNEANVSKGKSGKRQQNVSIAAKNKLKNISTDLLRHTPVLDTLSAEVVGGQINTAQYGNLFIPSSYDGSVRGKAKVGGGNVASLRNKAKPTTNWNENLDERVQPKYVFFIIGGMSFAEVRILYELERNNPNITVIMGTTGLMSPDNYIDGISNMQAP